MLRTCYRLAVVVALLWAGIAMTTAAARAALTTGTISGTVTDAVTKAPVAGARVVAVAPTGRGEAVTDAQGAYRIPGLAPDTYTLSVEKPGYDTQPLAGITVFQDQTVRVDVGAAQRLQSIGRTSNRVAGNLVQPNQTADVYNVGSAQLGAALGDPAPRTIYEALQSVPGVVASTYGGSARVRGGLLNETAYELDGIPINDRLTGLFTSNLSTVGIQNIEVYTGGYGAQYGNAATGVLNSVVKRGAYPAFGSASFEAGGITGKRAYQFEYGAATRDNRFSGYVGLANTDNRDFLLGDGTYVFNAESWNGRDVDAGIVHTLDGIVNLHWKPDPASGRDDIQFLAQSGFQYIPWDQRLAGVTTLGIARCDGLTTNGQTIVNAGTSSTGQPCVSPDGPSGLQYTYLNGPKSNIWYHFSDLVKLQWNHQFGDKLTGQFRLAENFNQYIFDQPFLGTTGLTDPYAFANISRPDGSAIRPGDVVDTATVGSPQAEYSDRRSQMYIGAADFQYAATERSTLSFGVALEHDNSAERYFDYCGCDDAGGKNGGVFNLDGSYPFEFLTVNYPLVLPSAYVGLRQRAGKFTFEPSVRYDGERYAFHSPLGGPYWVSSISPHLAVAYAPDARSSLRASFASNTTFVPAAYVYNASPNGFDAQDGRNINPFFAGTHVTPLRNNNVDLGYSRQLDDTTSFRLTPFYHVSDNLLTRTKASIFAPSGKIVGANLFKTNGLARNFGVEFGLNHVVRGDGLSWYLAGTYENYWSTTQSLDFAATSIGGAAAVANFEKNKTLYRVSGQPPWQINYVANYTKGPLHVNPNLIYQCCGYYNVTGNTPYFEGTLDAKGNPLLTGRDTQVHQATAYWLANLSFTYDLVTQGPRKVSVGMRWQNAFNNLKSDIVPVVNGNYNYADPAHGFIYSSGYDQYVFPRGALPNTLYGYLPTYGFPQALYGFVSVKF